jgi:hypothetical protein
LIARRLAVVVLALLLAVQVVRNAAVQALAPLYPKTAAKFWAHHPSVEISLGLAEIGRASRERSKIAPSTFAMIDDATVKSPLSPEPFLVRGVRAQVAGNADEASRAFLAAQRRDPRSMPAAYFLANYYFQKGASLDGLKQTALLARLAPEGERSVAPYVAAYAQNRANWPEIRALFRSQEDLEDSVLVALAQDSANADAILAIADPRHRDPHSLWLPALLKSLVASGDYGRARAIWSSIGGGRAGNGLIYDSDFSPADAPPPFNWTLASSTVGLAERQSGNRLHVIFYGSEDGALASELVLLPPGAYRLQTHLVGAPTHPEALYWTLRCDKATEPAASISADQAAAHGWSFVVPSDCPAQWLELSGRSGDVTQQSDVTFAPLALTRAVANG